MHIPVLLNEILAFLDPKPGEKYIDATLGGGGHAKALAEKGSEVLGIDWDPQVDPHFHGKGIKAVHGNFAELGRIAEENSFTEVDGILFDLGFSSIQLDEPERGFSFQKHGPLDMRYDFAGRARTAAEIVNSYSEKDLVDVFRKFGEEYRFAKRVARAVLETRKAKKIQSTDELFEIIKKALPANLRFRAGDTARRIFQSLRIEVNEELVNLEKALPQALQLLKKGGKLVVISFHSLEDRLVKKFLKHEARDCVCPAELPVCVCGKNPALKILTRKPVVAGLEEQNANPRSKSAKMRIAIKI